MLIVLSIIAGVLTVIVIGFIALMFMAFDYSGDGIMHINIVDFLLDKKDISLT